MQNLAKTAIGPVSHGYGKTYKGQLHIMSVALSNNMAISKSKLSQNVLSPQGHPTRAIHFNPPKMKSRNPRKLSIETPNLSPKNFVGKDIGLENIDASPLRRPYHIDENSNFLPSIPSVQY